MSDSTKPKSELQSKEDELLELAKQELMRDVKCASIRAEQLGAHSWAKPQAYVPSKRFLRQMLMTASKDNERRDKNLQELKQTQKERDKQTRFSRIKRRRFSPNRQFSNSSNHLEDNINKEESEHKNKYKNYRRLKSSKRKSPQ